MSPFLLLVILSLLIPSIPTAKKKEEFVKGRRFTALECRPENTSIAIHYCYIKAISRRVTTLNVGLTFIKPLKRQFNVQFVENYRYGNIYREVINTHKLDFCGLMGNSLSNPFVSSIMNEVKASAPHLFHKCPYEGRLDVVNLTSDAEQATAVFPEGRYRTDIIVFKGDAEILSLKIFYQFKSYIKDSFG